jgi:hypothetical protein
MKKFIFSIALILLVSGCASTPYGNFIKSTDDANEIIAIDAVEKVTKLYLPAKTTFSLTQKIKSNDVFGRLFINGLRDKGFAVEEFRKDSKEPLAGTALAYILDDSEGTYRISIYAGDEVLSRAYQNDSGLVVVAGAWSKKE